MQSDLGKLFIGGISWDTNEERLKEYFSSYGEVVEAVIMKDRNTGRARGFGFVVFADPAAGERVIKEKHNIDGRMVEAKRAVPKDDQNTMIRSTSSVHGSPGQGRTKKIFVGGLASSVTESDFKQYFEQFGTITDVVVMHDHNTQRPRGFGFITFELEDAVDNVLLKTFHELNGKMVEVKRAVPKELSPGPSRSPLGGFNYNMSRVNNFLDGFTQVGNFGRFNSIATGRNAFTPFGAGYGMGLNYEQGMATSYGGNANFSNNLNYGRGPNPYFIGNSNRFGNPIGYDDGNSSGNTSLFNSMNRDLWGNNLGLNYGNNSANGNFGGGGAFGNSGVNWGNSSPISSQSGGNNISRPGGINLGYGLGDGNFSLGTGGYGRNIGAANMASISSSYGPSNGGFNGALTDFNGGGSGYGDHTWRTVNSERDETDLFGYGLGSVASDASLRSSPSIVGGYGANKRQANRGVPPISSLVETEKGFHMDAMGLLLSEDR